MAQPLRTQHCHRSSSGHNRGAGLIPAQEFPRATGAAEKEKVEPLLTSLCFRAEALFTVEREPFFI